MEALHSAGAARASFVPVWGGPNASTGGILTKTGGVTTGESMTGAGFVSTTVPTAPDAAVRPALIPASFRNGTGVAVTPTVIGRAQVAAREFAGTVGVYHEGGGFFARVSNLWRGFLSVFISKKEQENPEAVYEAAIDERVKKHGELRKAAGGIVFLRTKLTDELAAKQKELADIGKQLEIAVEGGDDDVALVLLERKGQLEKEIPEWQGNLEKIAAQAEEAKAGLVAFAADIDKLKRERTEMMAKKELAEARIKINDTLDGLSTDADIRALNGVRENIGKLQAQADMGAELKSDSLSAKLAKIKEKAGNAEARGQLEALKRQMAATRAGAAQTAESGGKPI